METCCGKVRIAPVHKHCRLAMDFGVSSWPPYSAGIAGMYRRVSGGMFASGCL